MTLDDFREGPMVSGMLMLTEEESDALLYTLLKPGALLPEHLMVLRRSMMEQRGPDENLITKAEEKDPNKIDLQISKLQELKEKELAYKNNYSLFDEMFLCLRCLLDCISHTKYQTRRDIKCVRQNIRDNSLALGLATVILRNLVINISFCFR